MHALILSMTLFQPPIAPDDGPPVAPGEPPTTALIPPPLVALPPAVDVTRIHRKAIETGSFLIWIDDTPHEQVPATIPANSTVSIYGPWHGPGKVHIFYATIPQATVESVKAALEASREAWAAERAVSLTATGKRKWPLPSAAHDNQLLGRGPWPEGLDFPGEMQRYKRAAFTQAIDQNRNGRFGPFYDRILAFSRLDGDRKWTVSGGLLGVSGWRSDLYFNGKEPREFVDDIPVLNSFGNYQNARGYKLEFPEGAKLLDVLSTDAGVFEVRQRAKLDGAWKNSVLFTDEKARPFGYHGLTVSCASCHRDGAPGQGRYSGPLVSGGDQTFSFPIKGLER